jgi:hypothetical protein
MELSPEEAKWLARALRSALNVTKIPVNTPRDAAIFLGAVCLFVYGPRLVKVSILLRLHLAALRQPPQQQPAPQGPYGQPGAAGAAEPGEATAAAMAGLGPGFTSTTAHQAATGNGPLVGDIGLPEGMSRG